MSRSNKLTSVIHVIIRRLSLSVYCFRGMQVIQGTCTGVQGFYMGMSVGDGCGVCVRVRMHACVYALHDEL